MQSPVAVQRARKPIVPHHNRWLLAIGILKLLKAILFILVGIGAVNLLHKDVVDLFARGLTDLNFDPESRFVNMILDKVALLNDHRLRLISTAIFCYAVVDVVEGVGLLLEKAWAEYLTIIVTASFLPWEMFEVARHASVMKVSLFLTNAAVVAYLLYDVRRHARIREQLDELERRIHD
jgi:uncharacterized membrane protein (DUF2068 family)